MEGAPAPEAPAEPVGGVLGPECGVWVRSSLPGNDANPGTRGEPVKTIKTAISWAQKRSKPIYACGETYVEDVRLPAGVSLFGGFDCDDDWAYVGVAK